MSERTHKGSRVVAAAVIGAVHVAAIALAMAARAPQQQAAPSRPIVASLLLPQEVESLPSPSIPTPRIAVPDVVVPAVLIDIRQEAPPVAVAVASIVAPPAPSATPASTIRPTDDVVAGEPVMVSSVEYLRPPVASYPPKAKQARASGTVFVRAVVEKDGRVREVRVDRSSGYALLDRAACDAVTGALFRPYVHNGMLRAAVVIVPVNFSLKSRAGSD